MIKEIFKKKNEEQSAAEPLLRDENVREEPAEEAAAEEGEEKDSKLEAPEADKAAKEEAAKEEKAAQINREALEEAYCLGAGIDGETLAEAKKLLEEMGVDPNGPFNPKGLQMALRLLRYDKAVEEARKAGYESGKNEEIASSFRDKRRRVKEAAEIPHLGGTKDIGVAREESIFDLAKRAH